MHGKLKDRHEFYFREKKPSFNLEKIKEERCFASKDVSQDLEPVLSDIHDKVDDLEYNRGDLHNKYLRGKVEDEVDDVITKTSS